MSSCLSLACQSLNASLLLLAASGCVDDSPRPAAPVPTAPVPTGSASSLVINEVVLSNPGRFADEYGESPDWIELTNRGSETLDLQGYALSDAPGDPRKWTFGQATLGPGRTLIVFASGRDTRSLDRQPPADWHGLTGFVWSWADSAADPPGSSRVDPGLFAPEVFGSQDGRFVISANFFLGNNADTLGWSSAVIHHGFVGWDEDSTHDFSTYNQAFIEATLGAGEELEVRLCQAGTECTARDPANIVGTGVPNHRYPVPITNQDGLDLAQLTAFQVSPVTIDKTTQVLITDFVFSHTGYFLHTNFTLSESGETLILTDPSGQELDRSKIPHLPSGAAYGRHPDDPARWAVLATPTPNAPNGGAAYDGVCLPPVWSSGSGVHSEPLTLTATASDDCAVYYTIDGSPPSRNSTPYQAPLTVEHTTVVRSTAARADRLESDPVTHTYWVSDVHDLPVVSLTTAPALLFDPQTGIYEKGPGASPDYPYKGANFWRETEIPANVEFFEPGGKLGFETGVGLRIFGNYSRGKPMKSLALHFRGEYGKTSLSYPLFPDHPELDWFDSFVLRNSGNDFGRTMFRDALSSSLTRGMGLSYQQYRPSVVYINGQYWGLHNIREKLTADYIRTNFGLEPNAFDLLEPGESAQNGSPADWQKLASRIETVGVQTADDYAYVGSQVDIDNFIDYNCAEILVANSDWPGNNVKWWKQHGSEGRWRWILYDLDSGFGDPQKDLITQATAVNDSWPNPQWSTLLFRTLLGYEEFKARFLGRCAVWLATNFEPARVVGQIDSMAARIANEIPRFYQRWGLDPAKWATDVERLRTFARARPEMARQHFVTHFGLSGTAQLTVASAGGHVLAEDVPVPIGTSVLTLFAGVPLVLTAAPDPGRTFAGWSDGDPNPVRTVTLTTDLALTALFQ